jgi:glycosyltransferase involved in cell wall biosynthesis
LLAGILYKKKVVFRSCLLNDDDTAALKRRYGIFWPVYKMVFSRITLYHAINKEFARKWESEFNDKVRVVTSIQGVDARIFNSAVRQKTGLHQPGNKLIILSCGILTERKGYRQIFAALSKLTIPFHYIVIGQHKKSIYHRSSIKELGEMNSLFKLGTDLLGDRLEFISNTENITKYFEQAHVFLHMATNEGTPNILLEAMAVGMPVICRKLDGLSEELQPEGAMEKIESETELCDIILNLYNHPDKAREMGTQAAELIKNTYTFDHLANKLINALYQN